MTSPSRRCIIGDERKGSQMTVKELIKELKKLPQDARVASDDGNGWTAYGVYLKYTKEYNLVGIYARLTGEEDDDVD